MDVVMPGKSGIEATPEVLQDAPEAKVLILSMQHDRTTCARRSPRVPAGYMLKEAADTDVVACRARGRRRRAVRAPHARSAHASRPTRRSGKRAEDDPLSDRERDVLRLLALGHTNQEIAEKLFISVRTAETHRAHIMQKLRLSTRAELVRYALEHGMLEVEDDT